MPRFFFDICDNDRRMVDTEGTVLETVEEARQEALDTLGNIARDELPDGDHRVFSIAVRDETGRQHFTASLSLEVRWKDGH